MWVDYELYSQANSNYNKYLNSRDPSYIDYDFFSFLAPYLGTRKQDEPVHGTVRYTFADQKGTVKHIIFLSPRANEVIKALAGPYSHALLKAHFARTKDESQQTPDQPSQDHL
jgi:hypothetical protein